LALGSGEGIDGAGLGDNKEEDLGPSEGREFVSPETGCQGRWEGTMMKYTFFLIPERARVRRHACRKGEVWNETHLLSCGRTLYDVSIYPG
jgi:hypothetical protein